MIEIIRKALMQDQARQTAEGIGGLLFESGWPISMSEEVFELLDQALLDGVTSSRFGPDVLKGYTQTKSRLASST